ELAWIRPLIDWIAAHSRVSEQIVGVWLPITILVILHVCSHQTDRRWGIARTRLQELSPEKATAASPLPAKIVAWNLVAIGILFAALAILDREVQGLLFGFASVFSAIGAAILILSARKSTALNESQPQSGS
ncbi:hypothetical protein JW992_09215, partial [candidate division KSB1 bacterium]|nr:hypothetical protein [candidate division KSB1 bacterium]